jgi:RimJ/RimL family protein N-acetyltransferase
MNLETLKTPILETPRLRLRPMREDDAAMVVRWRNADHVATMSRETTQGTLSIETHLDWLARTRSSRLDYIIEIRDDRQSIGSVSFTRHALEDFDLCAELGKYIGEQQALGKGYAYEAAHRWLEYGFGTLGLECVFARTRRINAANIKINNKLGFWIEDMPVQLGSALDEWIFMRLNREAWLLPQHPSLDEA